MKTLHRVATDHGTPPDRSAQTTSPPNPNGDAQQVNQPDNALYTSERLFRTFFELGGVGNTLADPITYIFTRVNRRFREITGYSAEEIYRMTSFDLTHPDDIQRDRDGWDACLKRGDAHFNIEKRYVRKDGGVIWVNVTSTVIRDDADKPVYAMGVVRDVHDHHHALVELERARNNLERRVAKRTAAIESANKALSREVAVRAEMAGRLHETNRTLETQIDASPLEIIALNAEGQVTMWNHAAEVLFGWREEEVLCRPFPSSSANAAHAADVRRVLESSEAVHTEVQFISRFGRNLFAGLWSAPLFDAERHPAGRVLLILDITEKKFLERSLLDASEREQRRIGQELHDHLCQHLLGAAFATKAIAGNLPDRNSSGASQLDDLARLINDAVQQVRDIARGLNPVELDEAGLMSALQEFAEKINPVVPCELRCERPVLVANAEMALHAYRIAQEAVTNALKHAKASRIVLNLSEANGMVLLQIDDDGDGIHLGSGQPTGMGLAIMRYRARAIRGQLAVELLARGTRIKCTFSNSNEQPQ
jgi:PAS domain S-box-containing protein